MVRLVSLFGVLRVVRDRWSWRETVQKSFSNVVWCAVMWSGLFRSDLVWIGLIWFGVVWCAKIARMNWFSYIS